MGALELVLGGAVGAVGRVVLVGVRLVAKAVVSAVVIAMAHTVAEFVFPGALGHVGPLAVAVGLSRSGAQQAEGDEEQETVLHGGEGRTRRQDGESEGEEVSGALRVAAVTREDHDRPHWPFGYVHLSDLVYT